MTSLNKTIKLIDSLVLTRLSPFRTVLPEYHECGMCNFGEDRYFSINGHTVQFTRSALNHFDYFKNKGLIDAIVEFVLWKSVRCHSVIVNGSFKTYFYDGFKITKNSCSYCSELVIDFC